MGRWRGMGLSGVIAAIALPAAAQTDLNRLLQEGTASPAPLSAPLPPAAPAGVPVPHPVWASPSVSVTGQALPASALRALGNESTVFIVGFGETPQRRRIRATGSGFFIAPNLVVTNAHVVQGLQQIFVFTSERDRVAAEVIATSGQRRQVGDLDFAVLQLRQPVGKRLVTLATGSAALDQVHAFGFPSLVQDQDRQMADLWAAGDQRAMPTIVASSGTVLNVMENPLRVRVITHSAQISPGNSGGPLFDACGRVVGVNTYNASRTVQFTANNQRQTVSIPQGYQWALTSYELLKFLGSRGIPVATQGESCGG